MRYIIETCQYDDSPHNKVYWISKGIGYRHEDVPEHKLTFCLNNTIESKKVYEIIATSSNNQITHAFAPLYRKNNITITKHYKSFEDFVADYPELFL